METNNYFNSISVTLLLVLCALCSALFYLQIINIPILAGGILVSILLA